ncbi:MAG: DUF3276 family protein [Bacteroidales bacterium]
MSEENFNSTWKPVKTEVVKSGKRTYFFDVRETARGEMYLSVTESKKIWSDDGNYSFDKHTLLLYKESFGAFADALRSILDYIEEEQTPENTAEIESEE